MRKIYNVGCYKYFIYFASSRNIYAIFVRLIENAHNTGGVAPHNHHHRGKHHGHWYY